MYPDLHGKTALITGAGRPTGIGFGIAESLAANGMNCILADIPVPPGHQEGMENDSLRGCVAALRRKYGVRAWPLPLDLSAVDGPYCVERAVADIRRMAPELHVLINNAGIMPPQSPMGKADPDLWRTVMEINLFGAFRMVRACLPLLATDGAVINIASRAGKRPAPGHSSYSVSKAGLIMLTKCLAVEYAHTGLRANAICPGQVLTELNLRRFEREAADQDISCEERIRRMATSIPAGKMGVPGDIGALAAFLASTASSFITGQAVNICGGQLVEL